METINGVIAARRRRIAEEISAALSELGLNRKELALRMHRQPSEVTRWLSGNHNFTSDLLEEISLTLGRPISGAGDSLVEGYEMKAPDTARLEDSPACSIDRICLPEPVVGVLSRQARYSGMTLREYASAILCRAAEERKPTAADFCGIWGDGCPDADELRSLRTANTFPEL